MIIRLVIALILQVTVSHLVWSDQPRMGELTLINGNSLHGHLDTNQGASRIHWHGRGFVTPFQFRTSAVKSIKFPKRETPKTGDFAFELVNGDLITGDLVGWAKETFYVSSQELGELTIASKSILRLHRIEENASLVFASLAGLQDWANTAWDTENWQEDGASLRTKTPGASLNGDLSVPDRCVIEFELSWEGQPDFVLALAVDPENAADQSTDGWRIETAVNNLAIIRETDDSGDLDLMLDLTNKTSIYLTAFLDQQKGEVHVLLPDGTSIGNISVPPEDDQKIGRGIRLINRNNSLTLERLRVAKWLGDVPSRLEIGQAKLAMSDGSFVAGSITDFKPKANELVIGAGKNASTVALAEVLAIEFGAKEDQTNLAQCAIFLNDGSRLSGDLKSVTDSAWQLEGRHVAEKVSIDREDVRSLIVFENDLADAIKQQSGGRVGRLELADDRLTGHLVPVDQDAEVSGDAMAMAWHPFGCENASQLTLFASGRIVYRDQPKQSNASAAARALAMQQLRLKQQNRGMNFGQLFLQRADAIKKSVVTKDAHVVHVRTGDVIACLVKRIDDAGLHVETSESDHGLIPLDQVKAIELLSGSLPPDLNAAKRERLLTIPRLQKSSPPTHLLCSQNGDFLRCRLLRMDKENVEVEVQFDSMIVPRNRISQIIAFHEDEHTPEGDDEAEEPKEAQEPKSLDGFAQALKRDGKRITFTPLSVTQHQIIGESELLGACSFDLAQVDQLIFGSRIRAEVSDLAYNQWKLQPAVEPLVTAAMEGGSASAGEQSPLVGEPAPEIKLQTVDGSDFQLSEHKGKIVVLDFWASWCAPCMLTMPLVEAAIEEIGSDQVELFAVNLEEPADHVRKVLERHNLNVNVLLDMDGVAGQRFQARAIPQLVIVHPDGNVHKLYVGGGSEVVGQMTAAIQELLSE